MSDWPLPYISVVDPSDNPSQRVNPEAPIWARRRAIEAGIKVARALHADPKFAANYLELVKAYSRDGGEHLSDFMGQIGHVYQNPDGAAYTAHDFANIHRASWLRIVRVMGRMVGFNPYGSWGDPAPGGTLRRAVFTTPGGMRVFAVPNATGYYALTNAHMDEFEGRDPDFPVDLEA